MKDGDILTFRTPGGVTFKAELALTEEKRRLGLMYRKELAPRTGMFFLYTDEPQRRSMWMKNMRIPLDIVWLDGSLRILSIRKNIQPCEEEPCPRIHSVYKCQHAIEFAAGAADRMGLQLGDQLNFVKQSNAA